MTRRFLVPVSAIGLLWSGAALAQANVPGNIVPQGSPIPRVLPPPPPVVAPPLPTPQAAQPVTGLRGAAPVRQVRIQGATAFHARDLDALTAGLVSAATPVERIEAARVAILNRYRQDGYVLTTVTAQLDANGTLRFVVTEGHIVEVKLDGDIGPAGTQILRFLHHLVEAGPIDTATLERWLLLAQDVPGVTLRAVLQPSPLEPGALTLVAQVQHKALSGLLSADNRAFKLTGPEEGVLVLEADSLTEFGERTTVTGYHTNGNTQNFGQGSVESFIGGSGLKIRLYGGYGEANPSEFLREIGYHGTTAIYGGSLSYPVIRARAQTFNVVGSLDALDSQIQTDTGNAGSIRTGKDNLRVLRLGGEYALQDAWVGEERPAVNALTVRVSQGLPGLGASPNGSASATRLNEQVDFTKFNIDLSRTQTLFRPWQDASIAIKGRMLGQVTGDVLPPAEKFFLGGSEYNRGYYSGEVTGDNALVLSAELQLNTSYDLTAFHVPLPIGVQYYAFYDYGQTWEEQQLDANAHLSSLGIGARVSVTRFTEFGLEGVHRNTTLVHGGSGSTSERLKADAFYWRVVTRF